MHESACRTLDDRKSITNFPLFTPDIDPDSLTTPISLQERMKQRYWKYYLAQGFNATICAECILYQEGTSECSCLYSVTFWLHDVFTGKIQWSEVKYGSARSVMGNSFKINVWKTGPWSASHPLVLCPLTFILQMRAHGTSKNSVLINCCWCPFLYSFRSSLEHYRQKQNLDLNCGHLGSYSIRPFKMGKYFWL